MLESDGLYFAPGFPFRELKNFSVPKIAIKAYKARVESYYLEPATELATRKHAFACGVICCTAIDFIAKYEFPNKNVTDRFEAWLLKHIVAMKSSDPSNVMRTIAKRFYEEFRNGLIHEGRIKNAGSFSFGIGIVSFNSSAMTINAHLLVKEIAAVFEKNLALVQTSEVKLKAFLDQLKHNFNAELELDSSDQSNVF